MKYYIIAYSLLICINATGQNVPSLPLVTYFNNTYVSNATGFIISYKGKTYLVTNYHVLTHREASDTTIFKNNISVSPNKVKIYFKSKEQKKSTKIYDLIDGRNMRTFYTLRIGNRKAIDISILPISLPKDVSISSINLDKLDTTWVVNPNSDLVANGFPGALDTTKLAPQTLTFKSVADRSFSYHDFLVVATTKIASPGASGSPVYFINKNQKKFIGIYSGTLAAYKNVVNPKSIISSKYILLILKMFI